MKYQVVTLRCKPFSYVFSCFIWVSILLLCSQPFFIPDANAECVSCSREQSFDNLFQSLGQAESIRVIVRLDVDGIKNLTAASNGFSVVAPGRSFPQSGKDADRRLKTAIDGVADGVVNALKGTAFKVNSRFSTLPLIVMEVSADALATLETLPRVINCVPDRPVKLIQPIEGSVRTGKSDSLKTTKGVLDLNKPLLNNTTGIIGADNAWAMGYTGAGWHVAILDTGILNTHEFFAGKNIVEKCYSQENDCPDGTSEDEGPGAAAHYESTYQGYDHGTHVAGIATGNNGTLFGVAKDADIIAVQVFSRFSAGDCGGSPCVMSWDSDQIKGLEYVYQSRSTYSIASVNMSLGGGGYTDFCDDGEADRKAAIDNLRAVGIATVIATGNDGYCGMVSTPACISSSISVGASDDNDTEAGFNNWHPVLQRFFAPGVSIYSSTGASNTSYASWNGTSMATPHVAGAWAILRQADPGASVTDIYDDLAATGTQITTICPGGGSVPRINVDLAIYCDPTLLVIDAILPQASTGLVPGGQVTLSARASDHCNGLVEGLTVEAAFSNGDDPVLLYDDGLHDDGAADDGLYGNWWIPIHEQDPTTITYTASKIGYTSVTDQVDVAVGLDCCAAGADDSTGEYITNVTFAGIDNDSAQAGGYADYTSGVHASVIPGTDVNLSVTIKPFSGSGDYLSVFIDWNQNLVFGDPGERYDLAADTNQSGPFTTLVSVPVDAPLGDTRMRVIVKWGEISDPCGQFDYGEVEDYTVSILCDPTVLLIDAVLPHDAAFIAAGLATLLQADVTDQCGDSVGGVTVEATLSNGDSPVQLFDDGLHDDGAADDGLYGNWWTPVTEQDPTTITYTASKAGSTSGTDQVDVVVLSDYCDAEGLDAASEYITNVTFAGINNDTTQSGGYADYTAGTPANVTAGTDVNLSVTINPDADDHVSVFIDWNQNLVFDDPGERYDLAAATDQPGPFTELVAVPADAVVGATRLRVVLTGDASSLPCGPFDSGEVEDYIVNVACNSGLLSVEMTSPLPFAIVASGTQVTLQAQVADQCGTFIDDIAVETIFSNGDNPVLLYDDGLHADGAADDSLYGNWWIPINEQNPTTITCRASKAGFVSAADQVDVYFTMGAIQSLPLIQGWNLVSLPLSPLNTAIETVLTSIAGKYISVWSFSSGVWKLYEPANPGFSDLTTMDAGIGYWINMAQAATLTIFGTVPQNSIPILNGWNLVGYNSATSQDTASAMVSIAGQYVSVWAYINNVWLMYDPANPGFSDLLTMEPGLGYWINATGDCTWTM